MFSLILLVVMDKVSNTERQGNALRDALNLAWELGYRIALPIVFFAFIGRYLDKKFETSFLFLIISIFVSAGVSGVLVYFKVKRILSEVNQQNGIDKQP